jgi:hypothetical protein
MHALLFFISRLDTLSRERQTESKRKREAKERILGGPCNIQAVAVCLRIVIIVLKCKSCGDRTVWGCSLTLQAMLHRQRRLRVQQ